MDVCGSHGFTTTWRHRFGGIYTWWKRISNIYFPCNVTSLIVGENHLICEYSVLQTENTWNALKIFGTNQQKTKNLSIIHSLFHHWQYNNYLLTNNPTIFKKSINFLFLRKRSRSSWKFTCIFMWLWWCKHLLYENIE